VLLFVSLGTADGGIRGCQQFVTVINIMIENVRKSDVREA